MPLTIEDLFASPDHYLHSFDGEEALFVPMDREAYHRSIFLDRRISPASDRQLRLPVASLTAHTRPPAATAWIFHIAHCGSTLLARALDRPSQNLVLREPLALRQCAIAPSAARLSLTTAMISKRYHSDRPTVVKANVPVNFLLPDLGAVAPDSRAIFLHLGLRDYLLAILRDEQHRQWLRQVSSQLAAYLGDLSAVSDAERAARLWLAQMRAFEATAAVMREARSLDAERFFADPAVTLERAASRLEVPMDAAEAHEIANGPLFSTYSKNPAVAFDNRARVERRQALERVIESEIAEAQSWAEAQGDDPAATLAVIAI